MRNFSIEPSQTECVEPDRIVREVGTLLDFAAGVVQ
jgi:hypothetical protein